VRLPPPPPPPRQSLAMEIKMTPDCTTPPDMAPSAMRSSSIDTQRKARVLAVVAGLVVAIAASGCATDRALRDEQRRALYLQHAGAPVPSFRYIGSINGWTPLGDDMLAVWTRPSEAVLLTLNGPCQELEFATAISLTSQFRTVYAKFDRVVPVSAGGIPNIVIPCPIREIRPLDVRALRDAQREMRTDVREAPRDEPTPSN
jgi:hypothetical protein